MELGLFQQTHPIKERPTRTLSRTDGPKTSALAAGELQSELGSLQEWALDAVRSDPGKTQRELGAIHCPEDLRKIGRRLNELVEAGRLRVGDKRECSITHRTAQTYWIKEETI